MKEGKGFVSNNMLDDELFAADLKKLQYVSLNMPHEGSLRTHVGSNLHTDYSVVLNSFAFTPLHSISDKAASLIEEKRKQLAEESHSYPSGLRKQYEMQLQMLESGRAADIELMLSAVTVRPMPEPDKPYGSLVSNLTHPWSRGTVVSTPLYYGYASSQELRSTSLQGILSRHLVLIRNT